MHGETILCIANRAWHSLWRDSQHIMSRIARQNRVLYFEPGRNPDRRHLAEMWRNWPNFFTLRTQALTENLITIQTPSSLPIMRRHLPRPVLQVTTPWVARINASILIRQVHRVMKAYDVRVPILWLYSPYHANLVGQFNEKLACYYNYDEFPAFVQNTRVKALLREFDDRLTSRVDVVFATSRSQCEHRKAVNSNTYFVPNGVDFDLFQQALNPATLIPSDIVDLKKPIIGLVGWLGDQLDVDLLQGIAETFSDGSLVLVGPDDIPDSAKVRHLRAMSNVHFLGRKALGSLPQYLKAIDVALIPYLLEGYVLTAYPMKLHEYLAAGRAIVATALPELRPYGHLVRIAETHSEFIRQIGEALHDCAPEAIKARVAMARENTWDQRVAEIYRVLDQRLLAAEGGLP